MNIGDEGTGAHLFVKVYDCKQVAQLNPQICTQDLNTAFQKWGLPRCIKIDNGQPFVYPKHRTIPTLSILWWVGLGIEVIQNKPKTPQENGIVESLQGTLCSWACPSKYHTIEDFQNRLDEESNFQRNHYQIPNKGYNTRKELYPELELNDRKYHPDLFDMQRVYQFLAQKVWERKVNSKGDIKFLKKSIYISQPYIGSQVYITFDPVEIKWIIRDDKGTFLKSYDKAIFTEKTIKHFATMSKN